MAAADAAAAAAPADAVASPSQFPWMLVNGLPNDDDDVKIEIEMNERV